MEARVGLEHAAAPGVEDARSTRVGFELVAALDQVLVPRPAQPIVPVDRDRLGALAVVVDPRREIRRHAVGEVAQVHVEAVFEAGDHLAEGPGERGERRHHLPQLGLRPLPRVERPHQIEVQLNGPEAVQQGGETIDLLVVGGHYTHVHGHALAARLEVLEGAEDPPERAGLLGGPLVALAGGALDADPPGEVASCLQDVVHELGACRLHPVGEDHDLLEAHPDRFTNDFEEPGLKCGLPAEERDLAVAHLAGLTDLLDDRAGGHRSGLAERGPLTADAEDTAVVAHVSELNLDLPVWLHRSNLLHRRGGENARSPVKACKIVAL
ncbi:MAG: hypothetical protein RLP09_45045 [Sandaracinaceae bacterium]